MPNYIRSKTGSMFFFTVVTDRRRPVFKDKFCREALGRVMREVKERYPYEWDFSSFHRFVKLGRYDRLWCASGVALDGMEVGE